MYDLLIKGGKVIDPANRINGNRDIAVANGKIAATDSSIHVDSALKVIEAKGMIVTPGLIDIHAHILGGLKSPGLEPDRAGVLSGVTTVCDAGSTGHANFPGFKKFVASQAQTDVFCFIHMSNVGHAVMPELWDWRQIDPESILNTATQNRDIIKGIKIRAVEDVVRNLGIDAVKSAKTIGAKAGIPVMVHTGLDTVGAVPDETTKVFTRELLSILDSGDIITHMYTWRPGGVLGFDGLHIEQLKMAQQRGVLLDVAVDRTNWSLELAKKGLELGILPDTLSTDLTPKSIDGPSYSLLVIMSKFLVAGFSLEQLVEMTTINPARALREERRRGSLGIGMSADISIFEIIGGDFIFNDGLPGKTFPGKMLLEPRLTIKSGKEIETRPHFRNATVESGH